ncbi:MAG: DNA methyltransferase [Methanolobus sp.]|nr:DNA methyltransferase [Methanolobus sp.]
MNEDIISVNEIPTGVKRGSTLEINTNDVVYFTHGLFKYPCKFIPQIPSWAIKKYTKQGDFVIDPFAGSGTTLVEAVLLERNALGIDFDKLSQLLCKTKTNTLTQEQIDLVNKFTLNIFNEKRKKAQFYPDLHNIEHWFPEQNIKDLAYLKTEIDSFFYESKDEKAYNFLLVVFASIIRKCSFADDTSPKPYVSSKIKKNPSDVKESFQKAIDSSLKKIHPYISKDLGDAVIIAEDCRNIDAPEYTGKVSLAVTSPPYINAFDYVRSLRLENSWLGYYGDSNIIEIKKKQIGTECIPAQIYNRDINLTGYNQIDNIIKKIAEVDKKRAYVVYQFFIDMEQNISEIHKLLVPNGHYIIVVGNSNIRDVYISTHELLIEVAKKNGFELENCFSYVIKNRYLRIPRKGKGGLIKKDFVIDLVKKNG